MGNTGCTFTNQKDIENNFIDFYSNLWKSSCKLSFNNAFNALSYDHSKLSAADMVFFVKSVTIQEVYQILKGMANGKSPVPDGLNVEFYLFFTEFGWLSTFRSN